MLYEAIVVVRPGNITEVKEIAFTIGSLIINSGGVVRGMTNWGPYLLTKSVKKHEARHDSGHHFIVRFDASPENQEMMRKTVGLDPRMIRMGCVRLGGTLQAIKDVRGQVEWKKGLERQELGSGGTM